jgi:hypothetical protein
MSWPWGDVERILPRLPVSSALAMIRTALATVPAWAVRRRVKAMLTWNEALLMVSMHAKAELTGNLGRILPRSDRSEETMVGTLTSDQGGTWGVTGPPEIVAPGANLAGCRGRAGVRPRSGCRPWGP